jgi:Icc-related predicted phosphoesterase
MYHRGAFQYANYSEGKGTYPTPDLHPLCKPVTFIVLVALYSKIPRDVDIVLTHTPPQGILDVSKRGLSGGCSCLARRLKKLNKCRLHVFGHIHEAFGAAVDADSGRISINAALYMNPYPFVVDLRN